MCNQISDLAGPLGYYSGQTSYKFGNYLTVAFINRFQYKKISESYFQDWSYWEQHVYYIFG